MESRRHRRRVAGVKSPPKVEPSVRLGLRENVAQFALLVAVNAFVGAMVGLERSILPPIAEAEYRITGHTAMLSFIAVFGTTKALANYAAGRFADVVGRRQLLLMGWVIALPVPLLLMWAPSWAWVLVANALLGISQGFTWSMTVIMKIDLVGPKQRGLAMGLNECAGYVALAASAYATAWIASRFGLRPEPFYLGVAFVVAGLSLSIFVRETREHSALESQRHHATQTGQPSDVFLRTTMSDRNLSSVTQAGFVNNLNDGMAWGLFPLLFAAMGMSLSTIGLLTAVYPATWGFGQLLTGGLSDRIGRKWLIVFGMWIQAAGIVVVTASEAFAGFASGAVLLGVGTAMVYPTLLAVIGDVAHPAWRASSVGVYRLWRDAGYVAGALVAGAAADAFGLPVAMQVVAALTFLSGVVVAARMSETRRGMNAGQIRTAS
jgi:MFS family permease